MALNNNFTLRTLKIRDLKHEFQTRDQITTWYLHVEFCVRLKFNMSKNKSRFPTPIVT